MLRITTTDQSDVLVLAMEGRLCGAWAGEARGAWLKLREAANGHPIVLELAGVTVVDAAGDQLLAEFLTAAVPSNRLTASWESGPASFLVTGGSLLEDRTLLFSALAGEK